MFSQKLKELSDKLKTLRKENGLTQIELANIMNVNQATVSKWENENLKTFPEVNLLLKLSKLYNVTIDELLGKDKENENRIQKNFEDSLDEIDSIKLLSKQVNDTTIGNNLRKYRKNAKLGQEDLARILNVANGTISMWENNLRAPNINTLLELSSLYNVSLDELVGNKKFENMIRIEPEKLNTIHALFKLPKNIFDNIREQIEIYTKYIEKPE